MWMLLRVVSGGVRDDRPACRRVGETTGDGRCRQVQRDRGSVAPDVCRQPLDRSSRQLLSPVR